MSLAVASLDGSYYEGITPLDGLDPYQDLMYFAHHLPGSNVYGFLPHCSIGASNVYGTLSSAQVPAQNVTGQLANAKLSTANLTNLGGLKLDTSNVISGVSLTPEQVGGIGQFRADQIPWEEAPEGEIPVGSLGGAMGSALAALGGALLGAAGSALLSSLEASSGGGAGALNIYIDATHVTGCNVAQLATNEFVQRNQYYKTSDPHTGLISNIPLPYTPVQEFAPFLPYQSPVIQNLSVYPTVGIPASNILGGSLDEGVLPFYLQPTKTLVITNTVLSQVGAEVGENLLNFVDASGNFYNGYERDDIYLTTSNYTYALENVTLPYSSITGVPPPLTPTDLTTYNNLIVLACNVVLSTNPSTSLQVINSQNYYYDINGSLILFPDFVTSNNFSFATSYNVYPGIAVSANNVVGGALSAAVMPAYLQPSVIFNGLSLSSQSDSYLTVQENYLGSGHELLDHLNIKNFTCNFTYILPNIKFPASNIIGSLSAQYISSGLLFQNSPTSNTYCLDIEQPPYTWAAINSNLWFFPNYGDSNWQVPEVGQILATGNPNLGNGNSNVYINSTFKFLQNVGISAFNLTDKIPLSVLPSFLTPTISYDRYSYQHTGPIFNEVTYNNPYAIMNYLDTQAYPMYAQYTTHPSGPVYVNPYIAAKLGYPIANITSMVTYNKNFYDNRSTTMRFSLGNFKNFQADNITTNVLVTSSDARIKKNLMTLNSNACLSSIVGLQPVAYNFIRDNSFHMGFVAQKLRETIPEAVYLGKGKMPDDTEVDDFNYIDYSILTTHTVGAIQALKEQVEILKNRVAQLENFLHK